jgi:hypothetical protein
LSVFRVDPKSPDFDRLVKTYKLSGIDTGKPRMRFYPNKLKGDEKNIRSFKIDFRSSSKDPVPKIWSQIMDGFEQKITVTPKGKFD